MSVRINRVAMIAEMARRDISCNRLVELSGVSRVTVTAGRWARPAEPGSIHCMGIRCSGPAGRRDSTRRGTVPPNPIFGPAHS